MTHSRSPLPPPVVVNLHTSEYDEYIGLGTPWGNRYANTCSRTRAISSYRSQMKIRLESDPSWRVELKALSGKRLGCHCAPRPCHGDVLVELFLELYGPQVTMELGADPCDGNSKARGGS